ncbi:MAG TPA: YidC/Oxa1 family insertase periplasmic-domain containing protein, partial [bacterium]
RGGAEGETHWVAQRGKYFEVAMRPVSGAAQGVKFGIEAQPLIGNQRPKVFSMALVMKEDLGAEAGDFSIYCGPIDRKLLAQFHPQLEATMNWGWKIIEPFSKMILWSLKALHEFIPNYGVVLIVFSIIIKVVLWPLTAKSTKSMSRMAALQPKMKELQEKYKATPERLNKAMMQLYKDEKVNPFSGCWPMLLQMPLLYGLFIVFRSTIELRRAPFMLWIQDLSMPDVVAHLPFNIPMYGSAVAILPVAMGVTQFLMSKAMITDPKQKIQVYFMPIFMVLIFNTLPSGLNLYYALFNLWSYLQQVMLKKQGLIPALPSSGK